MVLFLLIWAVFQMEPLEELLERRPDPEDLAFNRESPDDSTRPIVVSADAKINVDVFRAVGPAVVNISATTLRLNYWMEAIPQSGVGTGFCIDPNGYILTNNHVVANAQRLTVTFSNGKKVQARLVGRDPHSDLAVIKVPSRHILGTATLGNSDALQVGQKTLAIGNPFGLANTLTTGIISALDRSLRTRDGTSLDGLIQTDAAINPGNSGGPLLNASGEVIGINSAIYSQSGGYQGIGFAIPVNKARRVASELIGAGRVARPWLGISGYTVTADLADAHNLDAREGVLVVDVLDGSPADAAGLRGGVREVLFEKPAPLCWWRYYQGNRREAGSGHAVPGRIDPEKTSR